MTAASTASPIGWRDGGTQPLSRRACLGAMLLLGVAPSVRATSGALPGAVSLRDELAQALRSGDPLVVLVSLAGCPFCQVARDHYLIPLHQQQALPVVQVDMRSAAPVKDLNGTSQTHDTLVRLWNIRVAPTVLFFGHRGAEVAPRLTGGGLPDYYGAYLDERLAQARRATRTISPS